MNGERPRSTRVLAIVIIVIIGAGLAAWEWFGSSGRVDAGMREVAVILTDAEPYPPVLYVEEGMDYRIAVTATAGTHSLSDWPGSGDETGDAPAVTEGTVVRLDAPAASLRDGRALGPGGPVVHVVDSLDGLAARGEVYYAAVIAEDAGLVPEQVRLTEGLKAAFGGVSTADTRMLHIEGIRLHLPVSPAGVTELLVDVPTPGTYNVVCEQGCGEGSWRGALRVEGSDSEVPWTESKDTDAVAELHRRAPDFILYDDAGRVVQLSDFQDEKPVFLNFWATWCPPCRREMPAMQQLYARRGEEFELLAVNYLENRNQVAAFMDELELDFPVLMDVSGDVNSRYGVWSYPTSLFLDTSGVVRGRFIGELTPQMMEDFIDVIVEYGATK